MDRRLSPRSKKPFPGVFETNEILGPRSIKAEIMLNNLNERGATIQTSQKIENKSAFISFQIPKTDRIIKVPVEIVWGRTEHSPSGFKISTYSYGIRFSKLSKVQFQNISKFVGRMAKPENRRSTNRRGNESLPDIEKRNADRRLEIPAFHNFIDGENIPTPNKTYYVRVEKALLDPQKSKLAVSYLRKNNYQPWINEFVYASCSRGNEEIYNQAVNSAFNALDDLQKLSIHSRVGILKRIHDEITSNKETLINYMESEGHSRKLAEWELEGMLTGLKNETLAFYKNQIAFLPGQKKFSSLLLIRRPDGVVCVSPPANAASSNSLTACLALLGGNTLVIKPPQSQPVSTIYLWRDIIWKCIQEFGGPKGAVNIIVGPSPKIMEGWLNHPKVSDIIFFGTSERGLEIGKKAYQAGKKPILELSGKDPLVVWKDANLTKAIDSSVEAFLGSTQICMVPKMILVHEDAYKDFIKGFIDKVAKLKVGLPSDNETVLSPVLKMEDFFRFLNDAKENGGQVLIGGARINHQSQPDEKGFYISPTIVSFNSNTQNLENTLLINSENFFPLIPVVKITSKLRDQERRDDEIFEKIIQMIKKNRFGLRISVWVKSNKFLKRFVKESNSSGLLLINQRHVGFCLFLATHGGTKNTGGPFGELNYMWQKTTHLQGIGINN